VRELLAAGYGVRAMVRRNSDQRNLAGLDVEIAFGDLCDGPSLVAAMEGCQILFHVAASYTFWTPDPKLIYETNVGGTQRLLEAAKARGIEKVVYTSSESTIGISKNGKLGTERLTAELSQLPGHYKRSKLLAEKVALSACKDGLPVVVVNPTVPVGPWDIKPTPTGQIVVDFLNGRMPAYVNTGLNVVDVQDVAWGHILAMEKGRAGERYILGNQNLTLREMLGVLGRIAGIEPPRLRIPLWAAMLAAYVSESAARWLTRRPPRIPMAAVRAAAKFRHFDCSKAVRELGMPQTPIEQALGKAVRWFRENGYAC